MASRLPHMRRAAGQANTSMVEQQQETPAYQYQQQQNANGLQGQQESIYKQGTHQIPYLSTTQQQQVFYEQEKQTSNNNQSVLGSDDSRQMHQAHQQQSQPQGNNNPEQVRRNSRVSSDPIPHPTLTITDSQHYHTFLGTSKPSLMSNAPFSYQYFRTIDEGNAGPRFIRPTVYAFGSEPNLLQQLQIPQGCMVQPFSEPMPGESPVQLSPFFIEQVVENNKSESSEILFRCTRCQAYVNPFFRFQDGGNSAICNICQNSNKVPNEYFSPINQYNERSDKLSRPELHKGVYDFDAPSKYPRKTIGTNLIMLCLEMTPASIQSGVFAQALCSLQMSLLSLPNPSRTEVSICTYGSQLYFYSIPKDLSNDPQLIVIGDLEDPFCPFPRNALFLNVVDDREKIDYLIEKLQKSSDTVLQEAETNHSYVVRTASIATIISSISQMLEDHPARIIAFTSQLPTIGLGKLKRRDDAKLMNTDQEKLLYIPQCKSYGDLSRSLLKNSVSVDLFVFCPDYCDLATISSLCTETGGNLYYYPHYSINDAEKIHYELYRNLTRPYFTNCIMTVRTSTGIILEAYYTSKGKVNARDLSMSSIHPDSVVGIEYKQDEKIKGTESFIQYACLYTDSNGQHKIRVINLALPVHNNVQNLFKLADLDSTFQLIVRKALSNITTQAVAQIQNSLQTQIINIFYSYRNNCAASSSTSQLILPESIKFLIIYLLALFKSELFKKAQAKPDARIFEIIHLFSLPLNQVSNLLYPKVYPIHTLLDQLTDGEGNIIEGIAQPGTYIEDDRVAMPSTIPCSIDRLSSFGIYLIDNSETIFAYVQKDADIALIEALFGVQDYEQLRELNSFPALTENDYAAKVNAVIDQIRRNRNGAYQNIRIVLYKDQFEPVLKSLFIEDELRGVMSYNNYICEIHKNIQLKYTS